MEIREQDSEAEINLELDLPAWEVDANEPEYDYAHAYGVELLFEGHPVLPIDRIIEQVKLYCGDLDVVRKEHMLILFFKTYHVAFAGGEVHPSIAIMLPSEQVHDDRGFENALMQTWRWQKASEIVNRCTACSLVTDLMASSLHYRERMALFQRALYAITSVTPCEAIHFRLSEQFIERSDYLSNDPNKANYDILIGLMNVRQFVVEGAEQETVTDTIGLSVLGLPDVQIHAVGLPADKAVQLLHSYGSYLYRHGDAIPDGSLVEGMDGEQWRCKREVSLLPPRRTVINITPAGQAGKTNWDGMVVRARNKDWEVNT